MNRSNSKCETKITKKSLYERGSVAKISEELSYMTFLEHPKAMLYYILLIFCTYNLLETWQYLKRIRTEHNKKGDILHLKPWNYSISNLFILRSAWCFKKCVVMHGEKNRKNWTCKESQITDDVL